MERNTISKFIENQGDLSMAEIPDIIRKIINKFIIESEKIYAWFFENDSVFFKKVGKRIGF